MGTPFTPQRAFLIQYGLSRLAARNGQFDFELLCFYFAQSQLFGNLHFQTGPVAGGGDQGRDFETHLVRLPGTQPEDRLYATLNPGKAAFACTIQEKSLPQKVRSDLEKIVGSGSAVEQVYFFCIQDVPVSQRHALEAWAQTNFQLKLTLFDGTNLAERLAATPALSWLAVRYLNLPEAFFDLDSLLEFPDQALNKIPAPSQLLRARYEVVKFYGRVKELEDLGDWCADSSPLLIRLYTGQGGQGKTRLMLELCRRQRKSGWHAGFIRETAGRAEPTVWSVLLSLDQPLLLVLDYAEGHSELIAKLLSQIKASERTAPKVRVVLLARADLDWWAALASDPEIPSAWLQPPYTQILPLEPITAPESPEGRRDSFTRALHDFEQALGQFPSHPPADPPDPTPPNDLHLKHFERVLFVHMYALLRCGGYGLSKRDHEGIVTYGDKFGLVDQILLREQQFWMWQLRDRGVEQGFKELIAPIRRAMALFTLGYPAATRDQVLTGLREDPVLGELDRLTLESIASVLGDTYPAPNGGVSPLEPDLIGERLGFLALTDPRYGAHLQNVLFGDDQHPPKANTKRALTVLARYEQWADG